MLENLKMAASKMCHVMKILQIVPKIDYKDGKIVIAHKEQ